MPRSIELREVSVLLADGRPVLSRVSLRIEVRERVALVGASGAGKTTALRLMNGLVAPSLGDVLVDGVSIGRLDGPQLRRKMGYVIQGVGLFPHRNVFDNVAVVPRLLEWEETKIRAAIESILADVNLPFERYATRFPRTLSGGEQQRVGVARALVSAPEILLCDEPFSALDPIVRREHQTLLRELAIKRAPTLVLVTHDLREAFAVAERIVLLDQGTVVVDLSRKDFLTSDHPLVREFVESATIPMAS